MQAPGLNTEEPKSAPKRKEVREVRLTVRVAWYLCLAAKFRTTLIGRNQFTVEYAGPVWLWYAAGDQERHDAAKDFETPYYNAHGFSDRPPAEQLSYYCEANLAMLSDVHGIAREALRPFDNCFETNIHGITDVRFVSEAGIKKVQSEYGDLWERAQKSHRLPIA